MKMSNKNAERYLDLKGKMARAGIKCNRIARRLKVSPALVTYVLQGRKKSVRVRRALARALNTKMEDLFHD